jgi:TPR repeat protein
MTLLEILRTAMGMPMPPPDSAQVAGEDRASPLGRGKLTADEFRYTLGLAETGDPEAQLCVGLLYYRGLGVRPSHSQSYKWLTLASEQGNAKATEFQQVLLRAMTPESIAKGRCLVARFKGEPEPQFGDNDIHFESPEDDLNEGFKTSNHATSALKSWQPRPEGEEHEPIEAAGRPVSAGDPPPSAVRMGAPYRPGQPAGPAPLPASSKPPAKSSHGRLWFVMFLLLVVGGGGTVAWIYWPPSQTNIQRNPSTAPTALGNITSASFSLPAMKLAGLAGPEARPGDAAAAQTSVALTNSTTASDRRELVATLTDNQPAPKTTPPSASEKNRRDAERGNPNAQFLLGLSYVEGKGVTQDFTNAVFWLRKAADQGQPDAQNNLGICYVRGSGVPKDLVKAYKWFSLAVAGGNRDALPNRDRLATMLTPTQLQEAKRLAVEFVNALPTTPHSSPGGPTNGPAKP